MEMPLPVDTWMVAEPIINSMKPVSLTPRKRMRRRSATAATSKWDNPGTRRALRCSPSLRGWGAQFALRINRLTETVTRGCWPADNRAAS